MPTIHIELVIDKVDGRFCGECRYWTHYGKGVGRAICGIFRVPVAFVVGGGFDKKGAHERCIECKGAELVEAELAKRIIKKLNRDKQRAAAREAIEP